MYVTANIHLHQCCMTVLGHEIGDIKELPVLDYNACIPGFQLGQHQVCMVSYQYLE